MPSRMAGEGIAAVAAAVADVDREKLLLLLSRIAGERIATVAAVADVERERLLLLLLLLL